MLIGRLDIKMRINFCYEQFTGAETMVEQAATTAANAVGDAATTVFHAGEGAAIQVAEGVIPGVRQGNVVSTA